MSAMSVIGKGLARALVLASVGLSTPTQAQAVKPSAELEGLQEIATNFYKAGDFAKSLEAAEKALALTVREFGPDSERVGIQSYSAGYVAEAAGRLADAERHYRQSVRVREKVYGPESAGTSQALEKLGSIVLKAGDIAQAEQIFQRVLKIRSDLVGSQHSFNASAHADLGSVAAARGNFANALASYREAVRLLTSERNAQVLAKSVHEQEIRRHRPVFAGLALAAWETGSRPGGNRDASLAESYAASQQAWTTSAAGAIARMSARLGAGTSDLGRRIRRAQDMAERVLALHEEDMKALAAWSAVQRADPTYSAVLEEFRAASVANSRDSAPNIARQKVLVDQLQAQMKRCPPGQKPAGCDNAEREREVITRELGQLAQVAAKSAPALQSLSQRLNAADAALPGFQRFTADRKARLDESQRLETAVAAERRDIVRLFPDYVALTEPSPISVPDTQALLGASEALVTILVGPQKSFVWAITRDRAGWGAIEADADTLTRDVNALRRGLDPTATDDPNAAAAAVTGGYDLKLAHALYARVLGPVAPLLAGKQHLIVVPTGPLSSLPFQVLLTEEARTGADFRETFRNAPWLIRRHALSVLPSVQSLAALRRLSPSSAPAQPFLGIGDPILTGPPQAGPQQRGRIARVNKPSAVYRNGHADLRALREMMPLPETALELSTIAQVLGAPKEAVLLRADASETHLKRTPLDRYRVIHFATHGLVAGELSGLDEPALVLTPPDTPTELDDGLLTASEVAALRLSADWVVLSACNTASGADTGAEALSGLARAFFYAGARGLLVSHWAVASQAAVGLTTDTFAALAREPALGRAEAFRRTMLAMIDKGFPPSYWGPFVIVGEGAGTR